MTTVISRALTERFPNNLVARNHIGALLQEFVDSGLAEQNLEKEIGLGKDGPFWSRVWEAMLYRYFRNQGFSFLNEHISKSGQNGPDFCLSHNGAKIWIEAVVPDPSGLPEEWLNPPQVGQVIARTVPHEQMVLRWTSVLRDKRLQWEARAQCGIVAQTDAYVVAVNSCRLSHFPVEDHGITRLPYAVESVFPVGPIGIPIGKDGNIDGAPNRIPRFSLMKPNGQKIPTGNFLDPQYAGISALLGCSRSDMLRADLVVMAVHNPMATVPIPRRLFKVTQEFEALRDGEEYVLHQVELV